MMGHFTKPQHSRRALVMGYAIMLFSVSLSGCGPATDGPTAADEQTPPTSEQTASPPPEATPPVSQSSPIQPLSDVQSIGAL
jgi:hypothetical protein